MSSTLTMSEPNTVLEGISWETYDRLVGEVTNRVFINYDRGRLEIVSPSQRHESWTLFVHHMIVESCIERRVDIVAGGSTTLRKPSKKRGTEPDACYWVQSEPLVRGRLDLEFDVDPTPDLVLESEASQTVLDRLGILAALDVGEVWRFDGSRLIVLILDETGDYTESTTSACFPWLPMEEFAAEIPRKGPKNLTSFILQFREWARENLRVE